MKKRRLSKNQKAASSVLVTIVILISVMFAVIIGSVIFFAFGHSAQTAQTHTETFNIVNASTDEIFTLTYGPKASSVSVDVYNSSSGNWTDVSSSHVSVSNKTVTVNASAMETNESYPSTKLRVEYNDLGYDVTANVILYAVIVFGMAALVPLVIVGGLLLKSLGFFEAGGKV